jgi:hypothetical protein
VQCALKRPPALGGPAGGEEALGTVEHSPKVRCVDWWRQIEEAIRTVEHVLLVLTPASLTSPYVAREWRLAHQEGKQVSPVHGPGTRPKSTMNKLKD